MITSHGEGKKQQLKQKMGYEERGGERPSLQSLQLLDQYDHSKSRILILEILTNMQRYDCSLGCSTLLVQFITKPLSITGVWQKI